jgi:FkbM family methyltransferase
MPLFLPVLKRLGKIPPVTCVMIGSRKLAEFNENYDRWVEWFAPNLNIVGFDADADAVVAMNNANSRAGIKHKETHYSDAVWSSDGEHRLYLTKFRGCSSLLKPNDVYMKRFEEHKDAMTPDGERTVRTVTLDSFCGAHGISSIDYLQIDVQGGTMHVLDGARYILNTVLMAEVEADLVKAYVGAPLFYDVWRKMDMRGFKLMRFGKFHCGTRAQFPVAEQKLGGFFGWADANFIRDLLDYDGTCSDMLTAENVLKLACIADSLDYVDLAGEYLVWLARNYPEMGTKQVIIDSLREAGVYDECKWLIPLLKEGT